MFSGKSEELIRRLRRAFIARKRVQVFKPAIDDRYSDSEIVTHAAVRMPSEPVNTAADILAKLDWRTQVIGIDESNFFGRNWSRSPINSPMGVNRSSLPAWIPILWAVRLCLCQIY